MSSSIPANPSQLAEGLQYSTIKVSKILQFSLLHHRRKKQEKRANISKEKDEQVDKKEQRDTYCQQEPKSCRDVQLSLALFGPASDQRQQVLFQLS
jgi:hypothetical protein